MSISTEITRIRNNIQNALTIIRSAGITVSSTANSDNLPTLVEELANKGEGDIDCGSFTDTVANAIDGGSF